MGAQRWCPAAQVQNSNTYGLVLIEHNKAEDSAQGCVSAPETRGPLGGSSPVPYSRHPAGTLSREGWGAWQPLGMGRPDITKADRVPLGSHPTMLSFLEDGNRN